MSTTRGPWLPPRWFIRGAWIVHRAIYSLSGGRMGLGKPTPKTYGTLRLHTTTLAMNGWGDPEPAWWLNLQANPNATVELPDGTRDVTARAAVGEERTRLWSQIERRNPKLDGYAARRSRETAVVVFEPRSTETKEQR